ncbi:TolC family outer membrane protein [Algibacillus agarilyticus]|uniref:TolC family outer membrane protein n=1 Tax=Algibacillus agarilyticus TaxID=2234133 RepID=UPI000DD05AE3|nr:TolC family outer membrane protein [Algibacillus agarilyticus]
MNKTLSWSVPAALVSLLAMPSQAENLIDVYQLAEKNDPIIQEAKANYLSTLKSLDISRSSLLPQLQGSIAYNDSDSDYSQTSSAGISLTQQLYHHDSWLNLSLTEKSIKQAELNYQDVEQSLILRTVEAYLSILKAKDNVEFVIAEKKAFARQLEQTKQRFSVGLTAITDVHEAQAQFDSVIAREITANNEVEFALENLRALTGHYINNLNGLNTEQFSTNELSPNKPEEWVKLAQNGSKTLLAQKIAKDIAHKKIDISHADHLPTADFNAGYGWSSLETVNGDISGTGVNWGVSVSVPIFSGGRTSALTEQAREAYVAASQRLEYTFRTTQRDVRNSFNEVKATVSRLKALNQTVISTQSALKATEAGFEVGTRTIVDVLNSTKGLFEAKRNLADARYNYILSVLNLKKSAGVLQPIDIKDVNRGLAQG